MSPTSERNGERQRADQPSKFKKTLPRLSHEFYRGRAAVFWTPGIADRATGWLTPAFHAQWQLILLHACARYALICPAYVLMPDHAHLLWLGMDDQHSDQRLAIEFLRKHLRAQLSPADWEKQAHDHVLREKDLERDALARRPTTSSRILCALA